MIKRFSAAAIALLLASAAPPTTPQARVTITRDNWGIAHVHGDTDADVVFGAIYAQAEDDFPRIEANYLTALGRTAEVEGESAIWADLRQRLYVDPDALKADYAKSPGWLQVLMNSWAAGLNYYLATHPDVHPRVITHFEPWMALSFTEGSIGGDIERANLKQLALFYGGRATEMALTRDAVRDSEPRGSNGIAIAPQLTRDGHALLLINPHTSFFFRSELGMESNTGLHAYGASTWGQFFLYQGFNERVGWMHTSSGVDSVDEFAETIAKDGARLSYRYGNALRPVITRTVTIRYRKPDGSMGARSFPAYSTHHGPIVRADGDKWIALALMNKPIPALEQSWLRTRAQNQAEYFKTASLAANSSNNTVYADADGHIALLHPQFVPVRDDRFDYRNPVDGADPATDWHGLTPMAKLPQVRDPAGGWLYNSNDAPWRAAGADSPTQASFPRYMDMAGANPRGDHATALLGAAHGLTPEGLRVIAYDPWMPTFDRLIPMLVTEWQAMAPSFAGEVGPPAGGRYDRLAAPVATLRDWNRRAAADSTATTLAMFWAEEMWPLAARNAHPPEFTAWDWMAGPMPMGAKLEALDRAVARLTREFGDWRVKWGEVNRFQRNDAAIVQTFDDTKPSTPVPFGSARWGSLASFGARPYPGTKRWYGTSGNSFVAIVEFGPRVRAWAVTAGGESGHPNSPHFKDEAERYATGNLRPVYFWTDELKGHIERTYHPGE